MKYLMVAIEYFTKWIEAELVVQITVHKVQHFVWKNIVCCFGVPKRLCLIIAPSLLANNWANCAQS